MECSVNVFYFGKKESLPEKHVLTAGDLKIIYENGCLRYISTSGTELIRNIYSAVRDRNWGTLIPKISAEQIKKGDDEFEIQYKAEYCNSEIEFLAEYKIKGFKDSRIEFSMHGKALRNFLKNRIGFCVLHPLEGVKGNKCKVTQSDGNISTIVFPEEIDPKSPATNISAMEWKNEAANCVLKFEGDVWEMEDHRNWTDSSYKTYCTPLSQPFPAEIHQGEEVNQKITFQAFPSKSKNIESEHVIEILSAEFPMPDIGTMLTTLNLLSVNECEILKNAGLKHLRYDLKFKFDWIEAFEKAVINSEMLDMPIELVLHFSEKAKVEVEALGNFISGKNVRVKKLWFVNESTRHTSSLLVDEVLITLRKLFPGIIIGGGTDAYFAEFNRNRFIAGDLDFVTYAVCPQVHAFDNDSLIENLAAQADTVDSALKLYPGKKVHISPVTLKQRFNVVASGEEPLAPENQLPSQVDERQMSLFAAGWTLGSIASFVRSKADAVTYYEAIGWKGIIQGDAEPEKSNLFPGRSGDVYPVYHLFRFIKNLQPLTVQLCRSNYALKYTGLVFKGLKENVLVIASHSSEQLGLKIRNTVLRSQLELNADHMPQALRNERFVEESEWNKMEGNKVIIQPYSINFLKLY